MAYKVNSDGKAPKGLKTGDTVVTGGGTYKITGVNSDGSYQSTKVNNTTTSTYKGSYQTVPSSSGGGSSSGGSSGGIKYNNDYSSTGGDIGFYGNNAMVNGASWEEMLKIYEDRANKIKEDPSLMQYANDEIMQTWGAYIDRERAAEEKAAADEARYEQWMEWMNSQQQPTYEAQYDPAMLELMNKILSRDDFSYDATKDPLYQQYSSMYQQEGDRAMRETMAEAAASAGGMNSYAITAAQQANNYYASQMANKIPELYQLAYEMYLQDKESDVQDLGILQSLDATQYNRYRDTMSDFYTDKNFAYGAYLDDVAQGNWQANFDRGAYESDRNFNYGIAQGNQAQSNWDKTFNNTLAQQELEKNRYDSETAKAEADKAKQEARDWALTLIENGVMPDADTLKAAEISETEASALYASVKAKMNQTDDDDDDDDDDEGDDKRKKKEDPKIPDVGKKVADTDVGKKVVDANSEEGIVAKAAKDVQSPNLTADALSDMLKLGYIVYDEKEDKFKRTYDFGGIGLK